MTDEYAHQRPMLREGISPEAVRLQWSRTILTERNFLSEWQAQECASVLAAEMGSLKQLRLDVISSPLRKRRTSCQVKFCEAVEVLIGHDDACDFRLALIEHDSLSDFADKPWSLRSRSSSTHDQLLQDFNATSFMARRPSQPARTPSSVMSSSTSASSATTSTASSSDVPKDWRQTVLNILLGGRMLPAHLPWNNAAEIVPCILHAIGDNGQGLYGAHHVQHRPPDLLQQGLECLLLQV